MKRKLIGCDYCDHPGFKNMAGHSAHMRSQHPKLFVPIAEMNGAPVKAVKRVKRKYTRRLITAEEPVTHANFIPPHVTMPRREMGTDRTFKVLAFCPYCPEPLPSPAAGAPAFHRCPYCATALPKTFEESPTSKGQGRHSLVSA